MLIWLPIILLDAIFIANAVLSDRRWHWVGIILALPIFGAFAYVIFEMIPEWTETKLLYHVHHDS